MQNAIEAGLWQPPPATIAVRECEVHVWRVDLEHGAWCRLRCDTVLSVEEQVRAASYTFDQHRRRYVAAQTVLRRILSRYLCQPPSTITLSAGPFGKPSVPRTLSELPLEFNLTRSSELCLVAIASDRSVGIDVEKCDPTIPVDLISSRYLHPRERAALRALPPQDQSLAFLSCWTRKEALLKALGYGLQVGLEQFAVTVTPDEASLLAVDWDPEEAARWSLRTLPVGRDYVGAMAAQGHDFELRFFDGIDGAR
jgi:4'-phosphopantetheinyl transferase